MHRDILLAIPMRLLGFPQSPDWTLCVQSNTPAAWLLSLPLVAPSCTSAQEKRGAVAPRQGYAVSGAGPHLNTIRVSGLM